MVDRQQNDLDAGGGCTEGRATTHLRDRAAGMLVTNMKSAEWVPWAVIPVEGNADGKVFWLTKHGSHGNNMAVGLFTAEPSVFRSTIKEDETIYVISGDVRVEFEDGDAADLAPGDVLWIAKGKKATWHVKSRFEELFVYSG